MSHDASVLAHSKGRDVVCTDQLIIGVHCDPWDSPQAVGRKAANRSLSDLAATAATPRALTLAVRAPVETEERMIRGWISGVREAGSALGADLCGGDLACSPGAASLCVTALGEYPARGNSPGRDRARPGDLILLTGPVGGSRLGRHLKASPRLAAGKRLHFKHGARVLMDVSDGLAWDLYRLCRASGVKGTLTGVEVHPDAIRAEGLDGVDAIFHALHDGEDYELIATLSPTQAKRALADDSPELSRLAVIGQLSEGRGLYLSTSLTGEPTRVWSPSEGGWRHGA